jgi:hypothetical protein
MDRSSLAPCKKESRDGAEFSPEQAAAATRVRESEKMSLKILMGPILPGLDVHKIVETVQAKTDRPTDSYNIPIETVFLPSEGSRNHKKVCKDLSLKILFTSSKNLFWSIDFADMTKELPVARRFIPTSRKQS